MNLAASVVGEQHAAADVEVGNISIGRAQRRMHAVISDNSYWLSTVTPRL